MLPANVLAILLFQNTNKFILSKLSPIRCCDLQKGVVISKKGVVISKRCYYLQKGVVIPLKRLLEVVSCMSMTFRESHPSLITCKHSFTHSPITLSTALLNLLLKISVRLFQEYTVSTLWSYFVCFIMKTYQS